jgi:hypothetical protein
MNKRSVQLDGDVGANERNLVQSAAISPIATKFSHFCRSFTSFRGLRGVW